MNKTVVRIISLKIIVTLISKGDRYKSLTILLNICINFLYTEQYGQSYIHTKGIKKMLF